MTNLFLIVCLFCATTIASENPLVGKTIQIDYETGVSYSLSFTATEMTWTGVKGGEIGRSETDPYQITIMGKKEFFLNWTEKDNHFVALVLNFRKMEAFAAGHQGEKMWSRKGKISNIFNY